ncbi:con-Ins Im1-like [Mytilus galloprovincialis]|uniref:con-Ins Im1-like n=1 Tax=Mytilus galloprovincialis TaxID=29158 RepID=UPI003F7C2EC7
MPRYAVWLLVFVFVIYAFIWPVLAGFEKYCMSQTERYGGHKDGICGDELSLVVTLVCEGKFSLPKKRSVDHKNSNEDIFPRFSPLQGQILGKRNALSYLGKSKRFYDYGSSYQGIVCECCYNHCSLDELSQYCLFDKKDS